VQSKTTRWTTASTMSVAGQKLGHGMTIGSMNERHLLLKLGHHLVNRLEWCINVLPPHNTAHRRTLLALIFEPRKGGAITCAVVNRKMRSLGMRERFVDGLVVELNGMSA
jgi:hypothetical protein